MNHLGPSTARNITRHEVSLALVESHGSPWEVEVIDIKLFCTDGGPGCRDREVPLGVSRRILDIGLSDHKLTVWHSL